jgi:hypothetical protein
VKLPDRAREDIREGRLSEKQSRALQGLSEEGQEAMRAAIVDDGIPADEAMRLSRALRASEPLPDVEAARGRLAELRRAEQATDDAPLSVEDGELGALLSALAAAASGGRVERAALAREADRLSAPAYDAARVEADVLALARSLARAPEIAVRLGGSAYAPLAALAGTLDALLDQNN